MDACTPNAPGEAGFAPPEYGTSERAERGRVDALEQNKPRGFCRAVYFFQREIVVDVRETEEKRTDDNALTRRGRRAAARRSSLIKAGTEEDGEQQAAEDELLEERREVHLESERAGRIVPRFRGGVRITIETYRR